MLKFRAFMALQTDLGAIVSFHPFNALTLVWGCRLRLILVQRRVFRDESAWLPNVQHPYSMHRQRIAPEQNHPSVVQADETPGVLLWMI
ncbi:hypothetical protein AN958_12320 [Leucoagaricus sp. SymC.cos]|nr:hypothetical protein AN958_12320 [Leucoagaricus sp. SymC.cos]